MRFRYIGLDCEFTPLKQITYRIMHGRGRCGRASSLVRAHWHTLPTVSLVDAALPHLATG